MENLDLYLGKALLNFPGARQETDRLGRRCHAWVSEDGSRRGALLQRFLGRWHDQGSIYFRHPSIEYDYHHLYCGDIRHVGLILTGVWK